MMNLILLKSVFFL